jgi:hypothetical protein
MNQRSVCLLLLGYFTQELFKLVVFEAVFQTDIIARERHGKTVRCFLLPQYNGLDRKRGRFREARHKCDERIITTSCFEHYRFRRDLVLCTAAPKRSCPS